MSTAALKRIEEGIDRICAQQEQLFARIEKLEGRIGEAGAGAGSDSDAGGGSPERREVRQFLDGFRAGEALGEASLGAWIEVCRTDCLRGGLRTVQMREGMHAVLLEQRLKELGGSPEFEIPEERYRQAMEQNGRTDIDDAQKLLEFTKQFPDIDAALKPIYDMADRLDSDPETQFLLRTIAQDERSTLEFLSEACELLNS